MDLAKLLSGLGLDNGKDQGDLLRQAENMWKMLDDLSENDPESYKKFVSTNIEQGKKTLEEQREAEIKDFTRTLAKDDFVATLKIDFLLKPRVDLSDIQAPKSVVIDEKSRTEYKGSLLLSVFAVKDQRADLQPSLDHFGFRFEKNEVCCSVCVAYTPSSARGLLAAPMAQESRKDLSATLGLLQALVPAETKKSMIQQKLSIDFDPKFYTVQFLPSTMGRLNGYLDCKKGSPPTSMVLESLLAEHKIKAQKEEKASKGQPAPQPKAAPEVIFKSPASEADLKPAPVPEKAPAKEPPKIQVLAEETNYDSMIVESKSSPELVELGIELDTVESMAEVDLDISKTQILLFRRSNSR
jgi:hypothetical protein